MRKLTGYGPSIIVACTALAVLLVGPRAVQHLTYAQTSARITLASKQLHDDNILELMNEAYRNIAIAVEPSVVHISALRAGDSPSRTSPSSGLSSGSGWLYDEHGHVVTNHHVVEDARRIDVQLYNGEIRPAEIVGYDRSTDIAVLKIPSGTLHPAVRRSPDVPLRQGDMVFAFGSPFDFRFSMSSGIVSGQGARSA
jgi:S1-C subfamily serine protease